MSLIPRQTRTRYFEFRDRIHRLGQEHVISVAMIHLRNEKSVGTRTAWFLFIMLCALANVYAIHARSSSITHATSPQKCKFSRPREELFGKTQQNRAKIPIRNTGRVTRLGEKGKDWCFGSIGNCTDVRPLACCLFFTSMF